MGSGRGGHADAVHPGPVVVRAHPQAGVAGKIGVEVEAGVPQGIGERHRVGIPRLVQGHRGPLHRPRAVGHGDEHRTAAELQGGGQTHAQGVEGPGVDVEIGIPQADQVELGPTLLPVALGGGHVGQLLQGVGRPQAGDPLLVHEIEELVLEQPSRLGEVEAGGSDAGERPPVGIAQQMLGDAVEVQRRGGAVDGVEKALTHPVEETVRIPVGQGETAEPHRHGVPVAVPHVERDVVPHVELVQHRLLLLGHRPGERGVVLVHAVGRDGRGHAHEGGLGHVGAVELDGGSRGPVLGEEHLPQHEHALAESGPQRGGRLVGLDLVDERAHLGGVADHGPSHPHVGVEIGLVADGGEHRLGEQVVAVLVPVAVEAGHVQVGGDELAAEEVALGIAHGGLVDVPAEEDVLHPPLGHRLADEVAHVLRTVHPLGIVGRDPLQGSHHRGGPEGGLPVGEFLERVGQVVGAEDEVAHGGPVLRGTEPRGEGLAAVDQGRHVAAGGRRDSGEAGDRLPEPVAVGPGTAPGRHRLALQGLEVEIEYHLGGHLEHAALRTPAHGEDGHRLQAASPEETARGDLGQGGGEHLGRPDIRVGLHRHAQGRERAAMDRGGARQVDLPPARGARAHPGEARPRGGLEGDAIHRQFGSTRLLQQRQPGQRDRHPVPGLGPGEERRVVGPDLEGAGALGRRPDEEESQGREEHEGSENSPTRGGERGQRTTSGNSSVAALVGRVPFREHENGERRKTPHKA